MANQTWTITFDTLPESLAQLQALPQASLTDPAGAAALFIAAMCQYPKDRNAALAMVEFLRGPQGLNNADRQFLADRMRGKDYLPRSFFLGATPENDYTPTQPYTVVVADNPYSYQEAGYITLHLKSAGADSTRPLVLRQKPSTGQWFMVKQLLLAGIRIPVSADPWA